MSLIIMTLAITKLSLLILCMLTLVKVKTSIMALIIMTMSITTLSLMKFSMKTVIMVENSIMPAIMIQHTNTNFDEK